MKPIYIFGSGGFSKEVFFLIHEINTAGSVYEFMGFIDVKPVNDRIVIGSKEYSIYDETDFFENRYKEDMCFAIGMGNPKVLEKIMTRYHNLNFPNLIHPGTKGLFESISFHKGNIVTAGCIFTVDIKVGAFNIFNLNTTVGHDTVIGNCNVINPGVNISGGIEMGDCNLVGTNAAILQYIRIGSRNVLGAGSMLREHVANGKVLVGIPAKVIKETE